MRGRVGRFMEMDSRDWRIPLIERLAALADAARIVIGDRKWLIRKLYELAEVDKLLPEDKRLGALRAVEKYKHNGITMIVNRAIKQRKVIVPEHLENVEMRHESTTITSANTSGCDGAANSGNTNSVPNTATQIVATPQMPIKLSQINTCVYSLLLNATYSPDVVAKTLGPYLSQVFTGDRVCDTIGAKQAGDRCDLQIDQNVSTYDVMKTLRTVAWVRDVISKPPEMFGVLLLSAD
jgi:hypothetical protein